MKGSMDDYSSAPSWRGIGGCFPSVQFRGAPICQTVLPSCPKHHSARPTVAYIIAGQARSFLDERGWLTYYQHVIKSFYSGPGSRVFLHLKLGRGPSLDRRWQELAKVVEGLRPAVVHTTLERDADLRASLFERDSHAGGPGRGKLLHPECFWPDIAPHFVLSRARTWWLKMAQAWESVERYESEQNMRFQAVVFSRPDITFERAMGPWCAYDLERQWYAPWGEMTPDMFWIFPRAIAARVLTTWTKVVLPCAPGQPCCNLSVRSDEPILGRYPNVVWELSPRVTYSNWMSTYWTRHLRNEVAGPPLSAQGVPTAAGDKANLVSDSVRPVESSGDSQFKMFSGLNHSLRGHGRVAANPNRVIHGKPRRNCTMHIGCIPGHDWLRIHQGKGYL